MDGSFYRRDGRTVEIRRIYNRLIIDELIRSGVQTGFAFRDELDVEWAAHPNWQYRISKFALPLLKHRTVPRAWYVDQLQEFPSDLEHFVLKPMFSFGGRDVKIGITRQDLEDIPGEERGNYVLQERVTFAPVIETPEDPSAVEIRVMYILPDEDEEPTAATTLPRLTKGTMLNVSHNADKTWVGSTRSFWKDDRTWLRSPLAGTQLDPVLVGVAMADEHCAGHGEPLSCR